MTRSEAKRAARILSEAGHYGIKLVEDYVPGGTGTVRVTSTNQCGMARSYESVDEAREDTA